MAQVSHRRPRSVAVIAPFKGATNGIGLAYKTVLTSRWGVGILILFMLGGFVNQSYFGAKIAALSVAAMAIGLAVAGLVQMAVQGLGGLKALGRVLNSGFNVAFLGAMALANAAITYSIPQAISLGIGVITAMMGAPVAVLASIEVLPKTSGVWRILTVVADLFTVAGFAAFIVTSGAGAGPVHPFSLLFALLASGGMTAFVMIQGRAAKWDDKAAQAAMGMMNLLAGLMLLVVLSVQGVPLAHWFHPGPFMLVCQYGLPWMALATWLSMEARRGLRAGLYLALALLNSVIAMIVQVTLLHNPAPLGAWVANGLIFLGSAAITYAGYKADGKKSSVAAATKDPDAAIAATTSAEAIEQVRLEIAELFARELGNARAVIDLRTQLDVTEELERILNEAVDRHGIEVMRRAVAESISEPGRSGSEQA